MPDLDAVYDELAGRLSAHEDGFRATDNPLFDELDDLTRRGRDMYAERGLLARG